MKKNKLLYYLDDDKDDLDFFKDAAERVGYKVLLFDSGHELLGSLRLEREQPDAIFLDVHMPILNGQEILNVIKNSEWGEIPVVMISGAYPKKLAKQFMETGASYLMKKRTSLPDLESAITEALQTVTSASQ